MTDLDIGYVQALKDSIRNELREILKDYHYDSDTEHMSKDVVTSLENIVGSLK